MNVQCGFGSITIAMGFYTAMWGQSKEEDIVEDTLLPQYEASSSKTPLLSKYIVKKHNKAI